MGESSGAPSEEADTSPLLARQERAVEGVTDDGQPERASSSHPAAGQPTHSPPASTAVEHKAAHGGDTERSAQGPSRPSLAPPPDPALTSATGARAATEACEEPSAGAAAASATSMAHGGTVIGVPLMPGAWPPGAFPYGVPANHAFGGHPMLAGTQLGYPPPGLSYTGAPCPHSLGRAPVPPAGSRMTVAEDPEGQVEFRIPAPELGANEHTAGAALTLAFAGISFTFVFLHAAKAATEDVPLPFLAFLVPFLAVAVGVLIMGLRALGLTEAVRIRGHEVELEQRLWGWVSRRRLPRASLTHVELKVVEYLNRPPTAACCLAQGIREHQLGFYLSPPEQYWLLSQLSLCLRIPLRQPLPALNRMTPLVPPPMSASL